MKKSIILSIAGVLFLTSFMTFTVGANDGYNFSIKSMGCNPEQPVGGSRINFWVYVSVKGNNPCVDVQGWIDGEPIKLPSPLGPLTLYHLIIDDAKCYFPVMQWPDDGKPHTVKFMVDAFNHYDETNEEDNIFEKTFYPTCSPQSPTTTNPSTTTSTNILLKTRIGIGGSGPRLRNLR